MSVQKLANIYVITCRFVPYKQSNLHNLTTLIKLSSCKYSHNKVYPLQIIQYYFPPLVFSLSDNEDYACFGVVGALYMDMVMKHRQIRVSYHSHGPACM